MKVKDTSVSVALSSEVMNEGERHECVCSSV